jgi:histidyl-tRNA synthetase
MFQTVRGTQDWRGDNMAKHRYIMKVAREITELYGFSEWETPIIENSKLFDRLGETSDVVSKEMYTFQDKNGDQLTLRPEGTAGICRAFINSGLTQTLPQKIYYEGPMFRHERPQSGRYRQFKQVGVEFFGPNSPVIDAEVIACAFDFLKSLKINFEVRINTLGDSESRKLYEEALKKYFSDNEVDISGKNVFRIMDSKEPGLILKHAPSITDYLTDESRQFYETLKKELDLYKISYIEDTKIFRGLDYYSHTIFEFTNNGLTVLAGGRYNEMVEQLGGPSVPAVGWAAGVERLSGLVVLSNTNVAPVIVIDDEPQEMLKILREIYKIKAETPIKSGLKKGLEYANKIGAKWAIFKKDGNEILKNLQNGEQFKLAKTEQTFPDGDVIIGRVVHLEKKYADLNRFIT